MAELILIGTGCGIPYKKNGPPCFAIKEKERTLIVDIGYDSLYKILKYVNVNSIQDIFITHTHPDHFWGVIPLCFYLKCLSKSTQKSFLRIFGHERVGFFLSFLKDYYSWFERKPEINFFKVEICESGIEVDGIYYYALKTEHSEDSLAYKFVVSNKKIVFTGDAEYNSDLVKFAKDAYILVSECSFLDNGKGHMDIRGFRKLFFESGTEKIVLVHNYRENGFDKALFKLKDELKESLIIGEDGLKINF
ncbi:MAG: ribonuclease Z [Proteobacteria bacterium]|nr:ribonuclease Z [Pseudomonadota bacterium]